MPSLTGLGPIFELGTKILERVIPDPKAKAEAQIELLKLQQAGELAVMQNDTAMALGQVEINKIEAASGDNFTRRWRPAMGWCCVAIFASNYIGVPLLAWLSPLFNVPPPPRLDIGEVIPVLLGMLGLGSLRTVERVKAN